ncbi:hypothetical protein PSMA106859_13435 [Pseudoalteromonas maricaloris]
MLTLMLLNMHVMSVSSNNGNRILLLINILLNNRFCLYLET